MVFVLIALMASGGIGRAQEYQKEGPKSHNAHPRKKPAAEPSPEKKFTPIEVQQAGPGNETIHAYFYKGQRFQNFQQLKEVIDSLNDPEASRLLKSSANKESTGTILNVGGGLLVVGALVYAFVAPGTTTASTEGPFMRTVTNVTPPDQAPSWILGISGGFMALIGLFIEGDAGQCQHAAVMRYNHQIESDQNLSMILLPQTGSPGLELTQRF